MKNSLEGKTVLVTGSTDGMGKLITLHLAKEGAELLLHGRNMEKGKSVVEEIVNQSKNERIKYFNANYSSLEEVNKLCEEIKNSLNHLDILINNVGIGKGASGSQRQISREGFELRFTVNYLSHVLLSEKLLPIMTSGYSNIINVASVGQDPIDFNDVMLQKNYEGFHAYKQSKTSLIMYTFDLSERVKNDGVKVNAIHPASLMNTNMVIEDWGYSLTTVEQGAEAVENLLFVKSSGDYYNGK